MRVNRLWLHGTVHARKVTTYEAPRGMFYQLRSLLLATPGADGATCAKRAPQLQSVRKKETETGRVVTSWCMFARSVKMAGVLMTTA